MYLVVLLLLRYSRLAQAGPWPIVSLKGTLAARGANPDQITIAANPEQNHGTFTNGQESFPVSVTQNNNNSPGPNFQSSGPNVAEGSNGQNSFPGTAALNNNNNAQVSNFPNSESQNVPRESYNFQGSFNQNPYVNQEPYQQQASFGRGNVYSHGYNYGSHGYNRRYSYSGSYRSHGSSGFPASFTGHSFSRSFDPYSQGDFGPGFEYYSDALKPKSRSKRSRRLLDGIIRSIKKDLFNNRPIVGVQFHEERIHRRNNQESSHSRSHNKQIITNPIRDEHRRNNPEIIQSGSRNKQIIRVSAPGEHRRNNPEIIQSASRHDQQIIRIPARDERLHRPNPENIHSRSHNKQIFGVPIHEERFNVRNNPRIIQDDSPNKQTIHPTRDERQQRQDNPENVHTGSQNLLQGIISGIRRDFFSQRVNHSNVPRIPSRIDVNLNNIIQKQNHHIFQRVTTVAPTSISPVVGTPRK